ncbi:bifunctional (p)ppGpp synthetase/guanosine-3',5'-bis(diphosphate) 3'-pyrophosphohydrolase [Nitratidesulfovibrio liaohensis]|uniref:Bifunctional (P)ppGpp synthetase/guanosine-3',5'-bis(Diphosphate) 3'-pyrophosphohydrolase n=1 Tax=Nitratidesulfovibrio liaohensis TaxID=2604158 RepID=A0ABY9R5U3_9BACT|nr:bifunctional (p)ppGpp synthetase/guanosine-3',5'-bis(diphosphate) 3'-pyrophosphohydrolase [Nitratidesulfovibrio liaohensis]WMW66408.1 bifunctional (p)ppGpp synthetase/guanosine-3',5'-bis(diphosphate) 3'-pyrophosphohydrolase [Nitratidesulfovibrio liaohensis]
MIRIQDVLDKVASVNKNADLALIQKAYVYAAAAHAGQTRLSGEPYLSHPLAVAYSLAEMRFDEAAIAAGLLHDTVEDTTVSIEDIDTLFGEEVADVVDGVTKISQMTFESKEEAQAENIRKMILAMAHDIRVLIVKLADRLHNMRTLGFQKSHKQKLIAQETMDIYAPLANRLGLHRIKLELEDLSFRYLKPDVYAQIDEWLDTNQVVESHYIERVITRIREILEKNEINGEVRGRIKHKYSIYKKMVQQDLTLDDMHDIIAFRVIVGDLRDCYAVLGLMHAQWKPVHGRFKDYISMPKANGYRSLHTTVIGPEGERMEIQIRTEEMHRLAEHGVASHWLYKEGGRVNPRDLEQFTWLHEILDRQKMETDSKEFMQSLRLDLFKDEVYVFTPRGDVKELPEGATPIDFAYLIHTEVGNHCAGAKVNGKLVPLGTALKSGDTIEVITDNSRRPSRDWLKFVKTAKARSRIQHYIRTEERERSIALGREMLEKEGRRMGINITKALRDGDLLPVIKELSLGSVEDLLSNVGYARYTPKKVLKRLLPKDEEAAAEEAAKAAEASAASAATREANRRADSVSIKGVDDILVRFARCCNPLPGDPIIGFISRGRGVTVHTSDCANVQTMEPERLISVFWDGQEDKPYPARIHLVCRNEKGVLAQITALLAEENVNIDSGNMRSMVDGKSEVDFTVEVRDVAHLYRALDKLRKLPSVVEVLRSTSTME